MGPDVRRSPAGNDPDEIPETPGPGGRPCCGPAATHEPPAGGESPSGARLWAVRASVRNARLGDGSGSTNLGFLAGG